MITILILAGVGLIVNLLGRWLIVHEDQELSRGFRWTLALVPLAELVYIFFRWERARAGSVVCAFSFALVLPLVGQFSMLREAAQSAGASTGLIDRWKQVVVAQSGSAQQAQQAAAREKTIAAKRVKMTELEQYLHDWYALLEERRGYLCDELPDETVIFNRDVAAYHGLLAASKVELAELQKLTKNGAN